MSKKFYSFLVGGLTALAAIFTPTTAEAQQTLEVRFQKGSTPINVGTLKKTSEGIYSGTFNLKDQFSETDWNNNFQGAGNVNNRRLYIYDAENNTSYYPSTNSTTQVNSLPSSGLKYSTMQGTAVNYFWVPAKNYCIGTTAITVDQSNQSITFTEYEKPVFEGLYLVSAFNSTLSVKLTAGLNDLYTATNVEISSASANFIIQAVYNINTDNYGPITSNNAEGNYTITLNNNNWNGDMKLTNSSWELTPGKKYDFTVKFSDTQKTLYVQEVTEQGGGNQGGGDQGGGDQGGGEQGGETIPTDTPDVLYFFTYDGNGNNNVLFEIPRVGETTTLAGTITVTVGNSVVCGATLDENKAYVPAQGTPNINAKNIYGLTTWSGNMIANNGENSWSVQPGNYDVTIDWKNKTYKFEIAKSDVAVENVTLNKTEATMEIGGTLTLTATVNPNNATNKTVTWTSDNETVATVDNNGEVTANAAGTATITAKAGEKTATCVITVNAAQGPTYPATLTLISNDIVNNQATIEKAIYGAEGEYKGNIQVINLTGVTFSLKADGKYLVLNENGTSFEGTQETESTATVELAAGDYAVTVKYAEDGNTIQFTQNAAYELVFAAAAVNASLNESDNTINVSAAMPTESALYYTGFEVAKVTLPADAQFKVTFKCVEDTEWSAEGVATPDKDAEATFTGERGKSYTFTAEGTALIGLTVATVNYTASAPVTVPEYAAVGTDNIKIEKLSAEHKVRVSWTKVNDADVQGYKVFIVPVAGEQGNGLPANAKEVASVAANVYQCEFDMPAEGDYDVIVAVVYPNNVLVETVAPGKLEVTGINALFGDCDAVYFDVNGRQVANPENGLYIRVANGKAQKVIIRK